jgi:hypothetical protein
MTKKSQGRLMRDAIKKDAKEELNQNRNWDELHERYAECRNLLLMHLAVGEILQRPDIQGEIYKQEAQTVISNIQLLTKDLNERAQELTMIYGTHSDKTGGCDENDIMLSFEIMEKYTAWLSLMQANVQPTLAHIMEITSEVEKRLIAKAAVLDPNVVTDVEVTESTKHNDTLAAGIAAADKTNPKAE